MHVGDCFACVKRIREFDEAIALVRGALEFYDYEKGKLAGSLGICVCSISPKGRNAA